MCSEDLKNIINSALIYNIQLKMNSVTIARRSIDIESALNITFKHIQKRRNLSVIIARRNFDLKTA